jgi:dihydropyrimidinase
MSEYDLVIRGGTVVSASEIAIRDIGVKDGLIAGIGTGLRGRETVDAKGLLVLPGGVDSHVHLDQPFSSGADIADGFASGTASAAAGGTTTVVCHAPQVRGGSLAGAVASYAEKAKQARIDHGFHLLVNDPTPDVLERELPALVEAGHRSVKIFMTYEGNRLGDAQILQVLAAARRAGALVCVHAEHHELIGWLTQALLAAGLTAPRHLAWAKPMVVEREATHRILALAEALDAPLQIFHVSGAQSGEEVARAQARGQKAWAETCTQYLVLGETDMDRPGFEGAKFMISPALRQPADREALWQFIRDGVIDIVSSDHSPLRFDDPRGKKQHGEAAPFNKIPNGVPGLAARLPILYSEGVAKGRIDLRTFVSIVSTNPARRFGLAPRKGAIALGADADIVLLDPKKRVRLTNAMQHHGSDYTPYEGLEVLGYPVATYQRGRLIFDGETVLAEPGDGRLLMRSAYPEIAPTGRFPTPFYPFS